MPASRIYVERMALTRSPLVPTIPTGWSVGASRSLWTDNPGDPGEGTTRNGDGMPMDSIEAISIWLIANAGQTLSGGGRLDFWVFNYDEGLWARLPDTDLGANWTSAAQGGAPASQRVRAWPALRIPVRAQRLLPVANGITVSGGSDVKLRIEGSTSWHPA